MAFGKFITLEGVEGCGKSTQARLLRATLEKEGLTVLATAEPGGSGLGEEIRRILKGTSWGITSPEAELFLFLADRAQHVEEVIRPALRKGCLVICDRFIDSTLAYQGYGRGMNLQLLKQLNEVATSGIEPDLTILLDCDTRLGLDRHSREGLDGQWCRFHQENLSFHDKVRAGYKDLAGQEPRRIQIVEASGSIEEVERSVRRVCREAGILT